MVRVAAFVAVNSQQEGPGEQETQEAREAKVISLYEQALRSIQRQAAADAQGALRQVLEDPLVQVAGTQQMRRLKFLSLKNLGGLLAAPGPGGDAAAALECYVSACELEGDDVVLWNRLGTLASEAGFWALARHAFERGLECSPAHPAMHAKLQLLLHHVGGAAGPAGDSGPAARPRHGLPASAAGLLRLPPPAAVPDSTLQPAAMPRQPQPVQLADVSWGSLLGAALAATAPTRPIPGMVQLRLPAAKKPEAAHAQPGTTAPGGATQATPEKQGQPVPAEEEVVRLQLTPGETPRKTGAAAADTASGPPAGVGMGAGGGGEEAVAGAAAEENEEHVQVELVVQPSPAKPPQSQGGAEPAVPGEPMTRGEAAAAGVGAAAGRAAAADANAPTQGTRAQRRRRSTGRRGQLEQQQGSSPPAEQPAAALISLIEFLGALSATDTQMEDQSSPAAAAQLETADEQAEGTAAAAEAAAEGAAAASQQQLGGSRPGPSSCSPGALVGAVPEEGLPPMLLLLALVQQLAASPQTAAVLAGAERAQLLRAAERVAEEGQAGALPPACCLVLAELCIVEAAGAAQPGATTGPMSAALEAGAAGKGHSGRAVGGPRSKARAKAGQQGGQPLSAAQLQRNAERWLVRYMSASAAADVGADTGLSAAAGVAAAAAAVAAQAPTNGAEASAGAADPAAVVAAAVRYWWARGQVEESRGAAPAAAQLYQRCLEVLEESGLPSIPLPHWPQPAGDGRPHGPLAISPASIRGKLEVLKLHDMVQAAAQRAQHARHADVADELGPFLLSCDVKEGSMAALDARQWQAALELLRDSAAAAGRSWVASGCQLRLLWHALERLPDVLELREGTAPPKEAALAKVVRMALAAASHAGLASCLEASSQFFAAQRAQLQLQHQDEEEEEQGGRPWSAWEWGMLRRAQRRLLGLVAGYRAAVVGGASSSHLSLQAASHRRIVAAAATLSVHAWALDPEAQHSAQATVAVLRALCEALAPANALLEGDGAFVALCLRELRAAMEALKEQHGPGISDEEDESPASDDYWDLKAGLHSCLYWLYGITLEGREGDPWAEVYEPPPMAERLLSSPEACLEVWPLVAGHLMDQDGRELERFEGFIRLVAKQFPQPPPAALRRLETAWSRLAASEAPLDLLSGAMENPLEAPWPVMATGAAAAAAEAGPASAVDAAASGAPTAVPEEGQGAGGTVEGMEVDGSGATISSEAAGGGGMAAEQQQQQGQQAERAGEEEEEVPAVQAVRSSLYRLLAALQMDLPAMSGIELLSDEVDAALEQMLEPCKYDLLYNPRRFLGWDQLAKTYHEAADWVLEEAVTNVAPADWASEQRSGLRRRYQRLRHLAFLCTALALKYAEDEEERVELLQITADRSYSDIQNVPPFFDQLTSRPPRLGPAAASPANNGPTVGTEGQQQQQQQQQRLQPVCERALRSFQAAATLQPSSWEHVLGTARCLRKLGRPAADWLPLLARACDLSTAHSGGALNAVHALHAARLKLLLSARSVLSSPAQQGGAEGVASSGVGDTGWEVEGLLPTLELVGRYCFLPETQQAVASAWVQLGQAKAAPGSSVWEQQEAEQQVQQQQEEEEEEEQQGGGDSAMPDAEGGGAGAAAAAGGAASAPGEGAGAEPQAALADALLRDCLEATRWCQQKDKQFHRATFRLSQARLATEGAPAALQELSLLFPSKGPRQPFSIAVTQIVAGEGVDAAGGGRKGKKRGRARRAEQAGEAPAGEAAEHDWGLCPGRASGAGQEETLQQYYGSVRKYLASYLRLVEEGGQVDTLRAAVTFLATSPAWGPAVVPALNDVRQLAGGHLVLCMLRSAARLCPPSRLLAMAPEATGEPATGEQGLAAGEAELGSIVRELEGVEAAEATLEPLYQFWLDNSLQPKEDAPAWEQAVRAPAELALRTSTARAGAGALLPGPEKIERGEALFGAYAELYVRLLGQRRSWEKLLALAKALKSRLSKGAQQPSEAAQRHLSLLCQQAYASQQQLADGLQQEAARLRPELAAPAPPLPTPASSPMPAQQQRQQQQQPAAAEVVPQQPPQGTAALTSGVPAPVQPPPGAASAATVPAPAQPPPGAAAAGGVPDPVAAAAAAAAQQARERAAAANQTVLMMFHPLPPAAALLVLAQLPLEDRRRYEAWMATLAALEQQVWAQYSTYPGLGVQQAARAGVVSQAAAQATMHAHILVQNQVQPLVQHVQQLQHAQHAQQAGATSPQPAMQPLPLLGSPSRAAAVSLFGQLYPGASLGQGWLPVQQPPLAVAAAVAQPQPAKQQQQPATEAGTAPAAAPDVQQQEAAVGLPGTAGTAPAAREAAGAPAPPAPAGPPTEAPPASAAQPPEAPPAPEPLTSEEAELADRTVALLGGVRQLQKVAHGLGQIASATADGTLSSKSMDQLLIRLCRIYAALARLPAPASSSRSLLHKACDELVRQHRRQSLTQQRSLQAANDVAAAEAQPGGADPGGAEGGDASLLSSQQQQQQSQPGEGEGATAGDKQAPRKRGRPARASSRELSASASEPAQQGSTAGAAHAEMPGSSRKRTRREASGSASPPPKQLPPPLGGAGGSAGAPAAAGIPAAEEAEAAPPPADPAAAAASAEADERAQQPGALLGAKRPAPEAENAAQSAEGGSPVGVPAKRLCTRPAVTHIVASAGGGGTGAAEPGPAGEAGDAAAAAAADEEQRREEGAGEEQALAARQGGGMQLGSTV